MKHGIYISAILFFASVAMADTTPPAHRLILSGVPAGHYVLVTDSSGVLAMTESRQIDIDTSEDRVNVRLFRSVPIVIPPGGEVLLDSPVKNVTLELPRRNGLAEVIRLLKELTCR